MQFQEKVLTYYKEHGRKLPWRETTDPYHILLSELMLQQTQVDRVIPYYHKWIKRWPTIQDLAHADRTDILEMWMGLGYNNRAINLHKAAKIIVNNYDSNVLLAMQKYKHVPGIGPYTSSAVQAFAANKDTIVVDTNIRRIFIHEFSLPESTPDKEIEELAAKVLPRGNSRDWYNALMDYGSQVLTARKTGIKSKTQQSKFEGSDRQARAKIVRHLLANKKATAPELQQICDISQERFQKIAAKLIKDDVIAIQQDIYQLQ